MSLYVVELESGVWLARWGGDPGRTLKIENAKVYSSEFRASCGLRAARRHRPFPAAKITAIESMIVMLASHVGKQEKPAPNGGSDGN